MVQIVHKCIMQHSCNTPATLSTYPATLLAQEERHDRENQEAEGEEHETEQRNGEDEELQIVVEPAPATERLIISHVTTISRIFALELTRYKSR